MIDLDISFTVKVPDREAVLDEISDMNTENLLKRYPLITQILGEIKTNVIKQLKGE